MKWGTPFMFVMSVVQIDTMKCFYCPQNDVLGFVVPPLIKLFCRTSTLMLVRGQFATSVFTLHAAVRSSISVLQAPRHQPPNQWVLGRMCL